MLFRSGLDQVAAEWRAGSLKLTVANEDVHMNVEKRLIETVGPERCLYGSECPGVGSSVNPDTGRTFDDIRPIIDGFEWLNAGQKKMIFEDNARELFNL